MEFRKAFTLPELMIALSITSIIGVTATGVAFTLSHAQSQTDEMCQYVQSARNGTLTIDADVRKAAMVTAMSDSELSLWTGDANADGVVNVDELVLISYVQADGTIVRRNIDFSLGGGPNMKAILDSPQAPQNCTLAVVEGIMSNAMYAPYLTSAILATDVDSLVMTPNLPAPLTTLLNTRLAVGQGTQRVTLTDSVALRCPVPAAGGGGG